MTPTASAVPARGAVLWAGLLTTLCLLAAWAARSRTPITTEIWALHLASGPMAGHMESVRQDLVHPPLMYLVHRAWLAAFGLTDTSVKALPLLFALPAIALFTVLASRATALWRLASFLFACAFLTAGAPAAITRMYGLGLLLSVISILLWDRWRSHPGTTWLAAWTAVMVLLVYTHFFGLLLLPAFVVVNWLHGARQRAFALAAGLAALSFFPWLVYVWPVYRARGLETNLWWVQMVFQNPIRAAAALPSEWMGVIPLADGKVAAAIALAINLAIVLAGALRAWHAEWFRISALLVVVPAALLFLLSIVATTALHGRFLLGVLPAYWLAMALLGERGGRAARILLYAAVLPWVAAATTISIWEVRDSSDAHIAAARLAREMAPGDAIVATGEVNPLYWEWSVELGRREPIRLVRLVEPRTGLEAMRLAQAERLTVAPLERIESVPVPAGRSLWLYATERAALPASERRLNDLGWVAAGSPAAQSSVLRRFVRAASVSHPSGNLPF